MDLSGQRLGPYQVLEALGRGGAAVVYRAFDARLQREVALKVAHSREDEDAVAFTRFTREMKLVAALNHPGIVPILDADRVEDVHFFAMPLMHVPTLEAFAAAPRAAGGRLPPEQALLIGASILDVLTEIHRLQIVHRDIKPSNIFVSEDCHALVSDFGIAKSSGQRSMTATGGVIGTPHYMAPEQLEGRPADARADLYAVGLILYRLLCGRLPFELDLVSVIRAKTAARFPAASTLHPSVPKVLDALLLRATRHSPSGRFQSASEFREALVNLSRQSSGDWGPPPRVWSGVPELAEEKSVAAKSSSNPSTWALVVLSAVVVFLGWVALGRRYPARPAVSQLVVRFTSNRGLAVTNPEHVGDSGRVRITVDGRPWEAFVTRPGGLLEIKDLPWDRAVSVQSLDANGQLRAEAAVRTPPLPKVRNVLVSPSSHSVLVDFDSPDVPLLVQLLASGRDRPDATVEARPGDPAFHHVFEGLMPNSKYRVRIQLPDRWSARDDVPFVTKSGVESTVVDELDFYQRTPDVRLIAPFSNYLEKKVMLNPKYVAMIAGMAEKLRSPELTNRLVPFVSRPGFGPARADIVKAMIASRDPRTPALARTTIGVTSSIPERVALARALSLDRKPSTCEEIGKLVEQSEFYALMSAVPGMLSCDRDTAVRIYRKWLEMDRGGITPAFVAGTLGFTRMGGETAAHHLRDFLFSRNENRYGQGRRAPLVADSLATIGTPGAMKALMDLLRVNPTYSRLTWELARNGVSDAAGILVDSLRAEHSPESRASVHASLAMLLEKGGEEHFVAALADPDRQVSEVAAWALGRRRHAAAVKELAAFVETGRDRGGTGCWALGRIGDPPAREALVRVCRSLKGSEASKAMALFSLGQMREIAVRADIQAALQSAESTPLVRLYARLALEELAGGPHLAVEGEGSSPVAVRWHGIVFPHTLYLRTGLKLYPGESIVVRGRGLWGFAATVPETGRIDRRQEAPDGEGHPGPPLQLTVRLGHISTKVGEFPQRLVAPEECEVILCPYVLENNHHLEVRMGPATGFALVSIGR